MRPLWWSSELDRYWTVWGHFSSFSTNIIARRAPEAVGMRTWPQSSVRGEPCVKGVDM